MKTLVIVALVTASGVAFLVWAAMLGRKPGGTFDTTPGCGWAGHPMDSWTVSVIAAEVRNRRAVRLAEAQEETS